MVSFLSPPFPNGIFLIMTKRGRKEVLREQASAFNSDIIFFALALIPITYYALDCDIIGYYALLGILWIDRLSGSYIEGELSKEKERFNYFVIIKKGEIVESVSN